MALELIEKLYGLEVKTIKELSSYDDKNFLVTVSHRWSNDNIKELWPHGYVFKVLNYTDSMATNHVGKYYSPKTVALLYMFIVGIVIEQRGDNPISG